MWVKFRCGTTRGNSAGSKFGAGRLLNGFLDLLTITFVVRFMTTPMHIFGVLGMISTLTGSVVCGYIAFLRYEHGNIQNRLPLLMLGILLIIVGIQFFSTGLLGDMLASMHQNSRRTPRLSQRLGGPKGSGNSIECSLNHLPCAP